MKHLELVILIAGAVFFAGCAENEVVRDTNRASPNGELARRAAEPQPSQNGQKDEGTQNLWSAQRDIMNRDGNPTRY
jgi:hypothetical protein